MFIVSKIDDKIILTEGILLVILGVASIVLKLVLDWDSIAIYLGIGISILGFELIATSRGVILDLPFFE